MARPAVLVLLALPLSAAGQQANQFAPPKTQPPDAATLAKIRARTAELKAEVAKLPRSAYVPDVAVYAKAAEWIDVLGEWFDPKGGEKTLAVLDAGFKRAAELRGLKKGGRPSWVTVRGKPTVRGYESEVDGSVQPFAVTLPADGELTNRRLDVVLHGRDNSLTEVKFLHARESAKAGSKADYIQLNVYGRGNNAYRWAGESDVFEAVKWLLRVEGEAGNPKLVDPAKVVLRGFSMGGAGTWHLGLHHPFSFAVIGPGAGFTTTRGYVGKLPDKLPEHVERCLRIYDAVEYAENVFNVPVVAYSGEKDPQKVAADNIFARLKGFKEPVSAVHLVAPGLEHRMPPEWQAKAEAEYTKQVNRERRLPERVRFVTYTTRYNQAAWAQIEGLDRHYDKAVFDGHWTKDGLTIRTENVRGLTLVQAAYVRGMTLDPEQNPWPKVIDIDGQKVPTPEWNLKEKSWIASLKKSAGKWEHMAVVTLDLTARSGKQHGLQGPIDDAFMGAFLVVPPTPLGRDGYPSAAFEQFGRVWQRYFRGTLPTRTGAEVTDRDIGRNNLVLFGDPGTNPLIARVLPKLPIRWTADELEVNGVKYDPRTHVPVMIYPNPLKPNRYVVINSGHTFREADLKGTNANLYPRLGDWAVLKPSPTKDDPAAAEVVAAGLFDEFWRFQK